MFEIAKRTHCKVVGKHWQKMIKHLEPIPSLEVDRYRIPMISIFLN
jgi:hypothetical protein